MDRRSAVHSSRDGRLCRLHFWLLIVLLLLPKCLSVGHDRATSLALFTFTHWSRQRQPTPVFLPGESQGRGNLVGYSPWGLQELDTTEQLHFHPSLSCIGEGSGNPLQCSCLENPRDGGAWWAAIYGIAQSQTQLKRPSSSRLVITFLPRSKCLLISWLQSPSAVILEPPQKSLPLFTLFPQTKS